jgi:molybdopterin synthase catalytic subunit
MDGKSASPAPGKRNEIAMNIVTENRLDAGRLFEKLGKQNSGSVIFHYAVVKNQAGERPTAGIRFEPGGDMEAEMAEIEADIRKRWSVNDILLVRRIGLLQIGDLISLVAVSSAASSDAFEACRYGLARIRKMASVRKTELFLD